jgi:cytochrome c-type biogenesis protein CcmH
MRAWAHRIVTVIAAAVLMATVAAGLAGAHPIRASLLDVEQDLMCIECHEPLNMVNSPEAVAEKQYVATLIAHGDTKQQVLNAMVAQYGVAVLGKPPASGFDLLIYILPPAILAAGIAFLLLALPRWRARGAVAHPVADVAPLDPEDAKRLDEDLARLI